MPEQTLVIIKPDALFRSVVGDILTPLSRLRLRIVGAKVIRVSKKMAMLHYRHLKGQPFFDSLIKYFSGEIFGKKYRRVLALVYQGKDAIKKVRKVVGPTNPMEAGKDTIRGRFGRIEKGLMLNLIHCSANKEEAEREIKLWFEPHELVENIYPTKTIKVKNVKKLVWK